LSKINLSTDARSGSFWFLRTRSRSL